MEIKNIKEVEKKLITIQEFTKTTIGKVWFREVVTPKLNNIKRFTTKQSIFDQPKAHLNWLKVILKLLKEWDKIQENIGVKSGINKQVNQTNTKKNKDFS
jgi:hypothetical protein